MAAAFCAEYQRIANLGELSKNICKALQYDWLNSDGRMIDFRKKYHDEMAKRVRLASKNENYGDDDVDILSDCIFIESKWNRYKKIYNFDPCFVRYLAETECGDLHKELFEKLPFNSFYISFGEKYANILKPADGPIGDFIGMFVHIDYTGDFINISIAMVSEDDKVIPLAVGIKNGLTFQAATNIDNWPDYIKKAYNITSEKEANIRIRQEQQKRYYMLALNACQYLCASNAEIRDIKIPKKDRPMVAAGQNKKKPIAIQVSNVGFHLGQQFEKMYQDLESETRRSGMKGSKKRPHIRRAHWHHYWTGPGRSVLEVKWLEPIFVMGTEEDIDIVVHEVKGASA